MKLAVGLLGAVAILTGGLERSASTRGEERPVAVAAPVRVAPHADLTAAELTGVVQKYCQVCHNDQLLTGNMSLQGFDVADPVAKNALAEKMIQKLRAGMMPPPGAPRPGPDTLLSLVATLEREVDQHYAANPNPGSRRFQRLNRAEYETSVRDLLGLEVNAEDFLPLDTKSANFDNIADVQLMSPTLMDAYMRAATTISRLAVGYMAATPAESQYMVSRWQSQFERADGAPMGTRGGTSVIHTFPADGEYRFRVSFHLETNGLQLGGAHNALHTTDENPEQVEISIDGERAALLNIDRWLSGEDIGGANIVSDPISVTSGPHRVTAAFIKKFEGPVADLITPLEWSIASTALAGEYGLEVLPHLKDMVVMGPYKTTGISDSSVRRGIFVCRPTDAAQNKECAKQILSRLATRAFRRPVRDEEMAALMSFYDSASERGFDGGVRVGLQAILASPSFVFRIEEQPANTKAGRAYPLNDYDLASRLSYFLWSTPPDAELLELAGKGKLADRKVLEAQTRRMLADPRAQALGARFAAQWLQLQDVDAVHPDIRFYPDYYAQIGEMMKQETETFFNDLVQRDRPFLELFTAKYSFMNEALAKHYGIPGVSGDYFRRVEYPSTYPSNQRQGLLSQGSVLLLTSVAPRTSPVLRGKWVMIAILGTPPPPPPAGVPALDETAGNVGTRVLTTRERMEMHRKAPVCNSCHRFMDPIGLALDNYDVVGQWRVRENGVAPLDTRGQLYDGTQLATPGDLNNALLRLKTPILRNYTKNLLAYAIGRRAEYYDMPTVRKIVANAEVNDLRMTSFILGVINSDAFRMQQASEDATSAANLDAQR